MVESPWTLVPEKGIPYKKRIGAGSQSTCGHCSLQPVRGRHDSYCCPSPAFSAVLRAPQVEACIQPPHGLAVILVVTKAGVCVASVGQTFSWLPRRLVVS